MRASFIDVALRSYPKWWTERYGDEMRAVIDDLKAEGRSENKIAVGLLHDAMRSRLQARGMPRTYGLLATRTRTSVAVGTLPWLATLPFVLFITGRFVLHSSLGSIQSGYPFQLSLSGTRVVSSSGTQLFHSSMSSATWVIGISTMVITGLFLLTLMVLGIGLSVLRHGIVREKSSNRRSMYFLTWVPLVSVLAIFALGITQEMISNEGHWSRFPKGQIEWVNGHPVLAAFMGNAGWAIAIAGWLITMAGLAVVSNRVNLPPDTLRFGRTVSVLTSISMTLTFITFIIWDVALYVQANQAHAAGAIVVSYPRHDLWLPIALALGLACLASIFGATSARRSWRTIYSQRLWDN